MKAAASVALLLWSASAHAQIDLVARLKPGDLDRFQRKEASVFLDDSLTITFRYTAGETEVRIPVEQVGWPSDWSQYKAVDYTFFASSLEPVAIGFSAGGQTKFFITEPLPGIRIRGVIPFEVFTQTRELNPLRPLGFKAWPQRLFTFEKVDEVVFRMRYPNQSSQLTLYSFSLVKDPPKDDIIDRKPLIDRYGQWISENWPEKAHSDEQLRELWAADRLEGARFPFCPLGGAQARKARASGFFRTEKMDGRWILIDPHGHPFFSAGMDLVGYDQGSFATDVTGRKFLFEELPPPGPAWLRPDRDVSFYVANIMRRFGEGWQEKWERHIVARLRDWGFNTIANWSDRNLAVRSGMPYVLPLSGWTTRKVFPFPYDFPDVFSREFQDNVDAAAKRQCEPLKDDANLIGWFIGNEPHWARSFGALQSWPDMLLADPDPSATKEKLKSLLAASPSEAEKVKSEFLYTCARQYFEVVTRAIRKHDPNHLVLGIRFAERPNRRWAEMSSLFDAFSINIYSTEFAPDPAMVREYAEVSGRPVVIGEFTAAAPGRGLQGLFYFGHKVRDQAERAKAYRYYVEKSAADPNIVGTHWFQMVDDLPTGRPSDEERLNYGFIDVIDLPYAELVRAARQTHSRLYRLKFGETQPFSERPSWN